MNLSEVVREFVDLLQVTEESDISGRSFRPNTLSSCRCLDGERMNQLVIMMDFLTKEEKPDTADKTAEEFCKAVYDDVLLHRMMRERCSLPQIVVALVQQNKHLLKKLVEGIPAPILVMPSGERLTIRPPGKP